MRKYCYKTPFTKVTPGSVISYGWRSVLVGRDLLLQHFDKTIGNEGSTNIWSAFWIHPETSLKPIGHVALQEKDLTVADILTRETKEWNEDRIKSLLHELAYHIFAIKPSLLGAEDTYVWPLHKTGEYTVKSEYFSTHNYDTQSTLLLEKANTWN